MKRLFGAIDLGASSGRVIAGILDAGKLSVQELHRFPNGAHQAGEALIWDFDGLIDQVRIGLRELAGFAEYSQLEVESLGVDTWAVDYGLLSGGQLIAQPNCYRDPRNQLGVDLAHERMPFAAQYAIAGMQFLPFNTVYQLLKQQRVEPELLSQAEQYVMLPDLVGYLLTSKLATERTNASSTGLLDATTREWSVELARDLGVDIAKFPPLRSAGERLGAVRGDFAGVLEGVSVVLVGSHDTASAVVGVPAAEQGFAFISSGTWSLLGAEIDEPILSEASREANFTNELGVDGKVRYLKNLSGLWLLNESLRHWEELGEPQELSELLAEAAAFRPSTLLDVSDPAFIAPGDMPARIASHVEARGGQAPQSPAETVAVILHSLAASYAEQLATLAALTDSDFDRLYVIGGGSQNRLLCQLTADYAKIPVVAGPVEATAIGNLLVQARAAGAVGESLWDIRAVIRDSDFEIETYAPKGK